MANEDMFDDDDESMFDRGRPPTAEERARGTLWVLDEKSAERLLQSRQLTMKQTKSIA